MKFAINHPYKFKRFHLGFLCGFMRYTTPMFVELTNIMLICSYSDTISVVFSFIAMNIVA
jgi:hypothetical protein